MPLALVRPAPFFELMDIAGQDRSATKFGITPQAIARTNGFSGKSWGLFCGDLCIACMGLLPAPAAKDGTPRLEAWFLARPIAAKHMLGITRLAQLTAEVTSEDGPIEIFAHVADGHRPGERLAAAIGFRREAVQGGYGLWIWREHEQRLSCGRELRG